jgi:hypothetical protein
MFGAVGGFFLAVGHLLSTTTFDVLIWAAIIIVVAGLIDGADPRWWLAVGGLVGVGMLNKNTIVALVVGLLIGLLATPQRKVAMTKWFVIAAAGAVVIAAPNLLWQLANGWPQLEMAGALAARSDGPADYLLLQIAILSLFLVIPAFLGWRWLWRDIVGSRWRAMPIAFAVLFIAFIVTRGKGYYVAPLYIPLLAAGAIVIDSVSVRTRAVVLSLVGIGAVIGLALALPIVPPEQVGVFNEVNKELGETYAWDQFVDQVESVYLGLPESEQPNVAIFTANYGQAGAIEILASDRLPQPVSGHNSYGDWGPGPIHGTIIGVGYVPDAMRTICQTIDRAAVITNDAHLENDEYGTEVWLCQHPTGQLADIWDDLRHFD